MQKSPILSPEMNNYRWLLPSLLGTNFLVRLFVLIRPLKYLDGLIIPDDAYYSLTIARNIAEGLGPYYFIDYTNGFQPLYVFLAAPLFKLFAGNYIMPVYGSLFMLVIFDLLSLYLLFKLTSSFARTKFAAFFVGVFWIFNPYIIRITLNGMETIISMFFILLSLYYFNRHFQNNADDEPSINISFLFGAILGFSILARIDNIFLAFFIITVYLFSRYRTRIGLPRIIKTAAVILSGLSMAILPWLIYSYYYTGDFYQISGKAMRFVSMSDIDPPLIINLYARMIWRAARTIFKYNCVIITVISILFEDTIKKGKLKI